MGYGFIYLWYDRKHKRYYVGCHWGREDDRYICSSSWMMQAYKHRPYDFKRRIIKRIYTSKQDMLIAEQRYLDMIKPEERKIRYYNLNLNWKHWNLTEESRRTTIENITIKTKKAMKDPEIRKRYLKGLKKRDTKSSNPEVRKKRQQTMIKTMAEKFPIGTRHGDRYPHAKHGSEEHLQKLSDASKELWTRPGHREKTGKAISEALTGVSKTGKSAKGVKRSVEWGQAISKGLKNSEYIPSKATRALWSKQRRGRKK